MKITKTQLKQIIKEELEAVIAEEGRSPTSLGLPHNIGQPDALLAGLTTLLSKEDGIPEENAKPIINLINSKLQQNPGDETAEGLRAAKEQIMDKFPDLFRGPRRRQSRKATYRDKAGQGREATAATRPRTAMAAMFGPGY